MRNPSVWLLALWVLLPAGTAAAEQPGTGEILAETARSHRSGRRVIQLWWLPVEYWEAVARELSKSPEEVAAIRKRFGNYLLMAVLDVEVRPGGKFDALSTAELVRRSRFEVDGRARPAHPTRTRSSACKNVRADSAAMRLPSS